MAGKLQSELKQTKPFGSKGQEAILGLWRTADQVRRVAARKLEPHGVTLQQYNILRILRGAGKDGIPTLAIGERLIEETPGITRLLDRMEAKQWVRRERCPRDRRQVLCYLTPQGRDLLSGLDSSMSRLDQQTLSMLSEAEIDSLIAILDKIRG